MKLKFKIYTIAVLMLLTAAGYSQMIGNPIGVQSSGSWSVGASMGYLKHQENNYENVTKRMVLKSRFGLTHWLDVYGVFGGYKLSRLIDSNTIDDYEGKYSLGYGGGLNLSVDNLIGSMMGWFSGEYVRFPSNGEYMENFITGGGWANVIDYDTREYQFSVGFKIPAANFNVYLGGVVWGIQRIEEQKIYLVNTNDVKADVPYQVNEGKYQSGAWTGGVLGIEVVLPQNYTVSVEFVGFNERNYQISFGVSQTGMISW